MTSTPTAPLASPVPPETRDRRIRILAAPILLGLLGEILLGNSLASVGSPYPDSYLAAHVALGLFLVALTGWAFGLSVRLPSVRARAVAGVTHLSTLGAVVAGTVFLLAGQAQGALDAMEGLAVLAILGAILLLVVGSIQVGARAAPAA